MNDLGSILFWDESHPLSTFHPSPILLDGRTYPTVEHAYQAAKFDQHSSIFELVANAPNPSDAKRLAREHKHLRHSNWADIKEHIMYVATMAKFTQHPNLRAFLFATGKRKLIENSSTSEYQ